MSSVRRSTLRVVAFIALLTVSLSASAATTEIRALLDLDNDVATGCSVMTVDGAFDGVEMIHTTTVDTTGGLPTVTAVETSSCTDPTTDTFGPPVAISSPVAPPWAVGIGNGVGGAFVVETYLPLTGVASGGLVHVGFETGSAATGDLDALLTSGGNPMTILLGAAIAAANIPTVGEWGLIILGILLVMTALIVMRNRPETRTLMMIVVLIGGATVAYAAGFVVDGMTGDWTGEPQLGADATGDALTGDLAAAFAGVESNILFLRYDMVNFANTDPVADDQTVATPQDTPRAIVLTGTDPDGDPLTFTIVTNPTDGTLSGTAPNLTYTPNTGFVGTDSFTFTVNDGVVDSAPGTVTINVTDTNDPPVVNDQVFAVSENSPNGTSVGTVVASDPDAGQVLTYAITGGTGATAFAINAGTGEITVADSAQLDFETTPSFTVTVQVTDDGAPTLSDTATITINLTDANDAPVVAAQTFSVAENSANGTSVGTVVASDPDAGQTLSYAITGGTGATAFGINGGTGEITVADTTQLDFETTPSFTVTVQVTDDGAVPLSASATMTINLTDVNEAPVVNDQVFGVAENSANGTSVGTVVASDVDAGQTLTYSITGGTGATVFAINATTGALTVADTTQLDFETTSSFTLTVQVTDDGAGPLSDTATMTINVTDVNDAPVVNDQVFSVAENSANGTSVGTVVASDPDAGQTLSYAITGGTGSTAFAINAGSGQITVADSTQLDFETTPSFTLTVQVTDDGGVPLSASATMTVNLTDVNEAPVVNDQVFSVAENSANGTSVGTVVASDPDAGQTLTYSITGGTGSTAFVINANTGQITVTDTTQLDFETTSSFTLTVQVTDDGAGPLSDTATITINLNNVNEPPVPTNDTYSGAGNVAAGNTQFAAGGATPTASASVSSALSIATNDSDPEMDALSYSVASPSTTNGGTVVMNTDGSFLYTPPSDPMIASDTFTYTVTDTGMLSATATVTITIEDFVWYVDNSNTSGTENGTSSFPFTTLTQAETASAANQTIYVFQGNSGTTPYAAGITLKNGQKLFGEGVDLVVTLSSTPVTLVVGNTANKPVVNETTGNAVEVAATAGDHTGVEIRGLDLQGSDNAIDVTATGANVVGVTISDNTISGAANEGIDLNPGSTGTFDVTITNNTITATGNGVDAVTGATAGSVELAVDTNTITSTAGAGLVADGTAGGTFNVTSLSANTVVDGTTGGMLFNTVIFEADPSTPGADPVAAGNTSIGTVANRVQGDGLRLLSPSGTLNFGTLDVFNTSGKGIVVDTKTNGTTFTLGTTGGTVDTTSGIALELDPLTTAMTLTTVNSTNSSSNGVLLDTVTGSLAIGGGSLSGATGSTFAVTGGTVSATYSGNISQSNNAPAVSIAGGHNTGTITFGTGTITATGGTGLQFNNADGTYNFNGTVTLNGGDAGVDIVNGSSGTINVSSTGSSITDPSGAAVNVNGGNSAFTWAGSVAQSNAGRLAEIVAVTGGSVTLSGTLSASGSSTGILVQGAGGGTFTFSGATKTINTGTNAAVTLSNNSGATINFTNGGLDIDTTSGAGFTATGGATAVTVTGAGNSVTTLTGTGVNIASTTIGAGGVTFDSVTTNGAANGILLTNVGANPFTATGGSIVNASSRGVDISGGTGNVSIGATISTTIAGRSVEVTGHTGGTVTFSGEIDDNGLGIHLDSNAGGTITFSGGLAIDSTTNTGFNAVNSGTVQATQNNTTILNTVDTTTGTAVNIQNTTIGASGVTFRSVSANGATNGIVLNATGTSGGLTITGDGSTADSGGTIQNTTGDAISLTNTSDVDLSFVRVSGSSANGISGSSVTNFALRNSTITGNGDAVNEGGLRFDQNLLGTATISDSTITASAEHNIEIINTSSTALNLTIEDSTISDTALSGLGADGLLIETRSSANAAVTVIDGTFSNNASDGIQVSAIDSSTASLIVREDDGTSTFSTGARGLNLSAATNADLTFDVSDTDFTSFSPALGEEAINIALVSTSTASSLLSGKVDNNVFSSSGGAVGVDLRGNGIATLSITNNTATSSINREVIDIITGDAVGDATVLNLTATGNTITSANRDAFFLEALRATGLCLNIRGNVATPGAGDDAYVIFDSTSGSTRLESSSTDCAGAACSDAEAHILATNTGTPVTVDPLTLVSPGTCSTP